MEISQTSLVFSRPTVPIIVGIWAEQRAASSEFTNLKLHTFIIEAFLVVLVESFHKDRVFAVTSGTPGSHIFC
jgi:hypothetical protein